MDEILSKKGLFFIARPKKFKVSYGKEDYCNRDLDRFVIMSSSLINTFSM